jgi:hypothetical protein
MPLESSCMTKLGRGPMLWALACGLAACVQARPTRAPQEDAWRTECVGYYAIQVPSMVDYGAIDPSNMWPFNPYWVFTLNGAPAFDMDSVPDPGTLSQEKWEKQPIYLSRLTTSDALKLIMDKINGKQEHEKQVLLDEADGFDKDPVFDKSGSVRAKLRADAEALRFYKPVPGIQAIADDDGKQTHFYVYLDNQRIAQALRPSLASPAKTIEAFLQQYNTREPFAMPAMPGACLPYGFYRGEQEPAYISTTFTLSDHPDIVINLRTANASHGVGEPRQMLITQLRGHLAQSEEVLPLDGRLKPSHAVTIDGQEGLGHFALVRRKESKPGAKNALDNPYTKDHGDWVYVAYAPGLSGGKPGESFSIQVRIERFGRFAKEPPGKQMTEKQFREFAKRIVAGIHRRPGAWVAK